MKKSVLALILLLAVLLACLCLAAIGTTGLLLRRGRPEALIVLSTETPSPTAPDVTPTPTHSPTSLPTTPTPSPTSPTPPSPTPTPRPTEPPPLQATPTPTPPPHPTATFTPPPTPTATAEPSTLEKLLTTEVPIRDLYSLTARLKKLEEPIRRVVHEVPLEYRVGDTVTMWVSDSESDTHFSISTTMRLISEYAYWWVQAEAEVDERDLRRSADTFDLVVYPTNRRYFGQESSPGVDGDPRIHVLLARAPGRVVGYFSSADAYPRVVNPYSNEREMVFLNIDYAQPGTGYFDSILAHEFQHMIHWHQDQNEDGWVNEGASQLAEELNGYDGTGFVSAFAASPDTQLNTWADEIGNNAVHYGAAYVMMTYLNQRFGPDFMRDLVAEEANGAEGVDRVLARHGLELTFEDIFKDWLVANYLDNPSLLDGRYGYQHIDVDVANDDLLDFYPIRRTTDVRQFAADYVELWPDGQNVEIVFQGDRTVRLVPNQPHSGRFQWWSNRGDESDMTLTRAFDLSGLSTATLEVWLWYNLEEDWDYAYIEVSGDGGLTWDMLSGKYTTTTNPNGNNFGEGLTGKSTEAGGGSDDGWVVETLDLTPYAGREILIRFEVVTDAAVNNVGFVVDDIAIPELAYLDNAESGDGGWIAEGFIRSDNVIPQRFAVQLIELGAETLVRGSRGATAGQNVVLREMLLDDDAQEGRLVIEGFGQDVERAILIIAGLTPVTTEPGGYSYEVNPLSRP